VKSLCIFGVADDLSKKLTQQIAHLVTRKVEALHEEMRNTKDDSDYLEVLA